MHTGTRGVVCVKWLSLLNGSFLPSGALHKATSAFTCIICHIFFLPRGHARPLGGAEYTQASWFQGPLHSENGRPRELLFVGCVNILSYCKLNGAIHKVLIHFIITLINQLHASRNIFNKK